MRPAWDLKQYFVVIHNPQRGYAERFYVAEKARMAVSDPVDCSAMRERHIAKNDDRIEHGGARVSQFYRLSETALSHRDDLNRIQAEVDDAKVFVLGMGEHLA